MSKEQWELFILGRTWWVDHKIDGVYSCLIHGVRLYIPYEKLHTLEDKYAKRANKLMGG